MNRRKTFTLIELLVVIAIIAILASMLLPSLQRAREAGFTTDCMNRQKQIGMMLLTYSNDFKGNSPPPYYDTKDTYINWAPRLWKHGYSGIGYGTDGDAVRSAHKRFLCPRLNPLLNGKAYNTNYNSAFTQQTYGMMLYPDGTVVDDLLVYKEFEPNRYLLVVNASNIAKDYEILLGELREYNPELLDKERLLAITKCDMVDGEIIDHLKTTLPEGIPAYFISSVAMQGITELKDALWGVLNK